MDVTGINGLTITDTAMDTNMPTADPRTPSRPHERHSIRDSPSTTDAPATPPHSIRRRLVVNPLAFITGPSHPHRAIQSSRYEPYPFLSQGEEYSPDMWSGRRFSIADKSKTWYDRKGLEPLSAYENFTDIADPGWIHPTQECQRIGCWQETPHEHTKAELRNNLEEPATANSIIHIEDEEDRARAFSTAFDDDEDYQRAIQATPARTKPPSRIRNIRDPSSLLVVYKDGVNDLRRALPKAAEVIDITEPPSPIIHPRPPGDLFELPIRPVDDRKAPAIKQGEANVSLSRGTNKSSDESSLRTSRPTEISQERALVNIENIPVRSKSRAPMTAAIKERQKRALQKSADLTAEEIERLLIEQGI